MIMINNNDYCDYDTCIALKELGFPLVAKEVRYEDNAVFVPGVLLYAAQKWLRDEKKIHIEVLYQPATWTCKIYKLTTYEYIKGYTCFVSYEEALLEGIKEAIKILKEE